MRCAAVALGVLATALSVCGQELPPAVPEAQKRPELTLAARVTSDGAAPNTVWTVSAEGTAQYPDETRLVLEIQLVGNSGYIDEKYQVGVKNGRWKGQVEVRRAVYKGEYEVRISFDPIHQENVILNRIRFDLDKGLNEAKTRVFVGTKEEVEQEKKEVLQFYARCHAKTRELVTRLEAEYAKQKKEPVRAAWADFADRFLYDLTNADREREVFRTLRMNVAEPEIQSKLALIHATISNFLVSQMELSLGFNGKPDPGAETQARQGLESVRVTMAWLDARLADVTLDPNWKMPEKPKVVREGQPLPPGLAEPIGIVPPSMPVGPAGPKGSRISDGPKLGLVEGGIGFAALCGVAILVVLLKKK